MMNIFTVFNALQEKYPERKPGSLGASSVINEIKNQAAAWGVPVKTEKFSVYQLKTSILTFSVVSLLTLILGFLYPQAGLIIQIILNLLLFADTLSPVPVKAASGHGENLTVTIPARSKETQKVIVVTGVSSDHFIEPCPRMAAPIFLGLAFLLSSVILISQVLYTTLHTVIFPVISFIFVLGMICLAFYPKNTGSANANLNNCAVLTELGSILAKARPTTTTVVLCFSGSHSLNSGISKIPKLLKGGPEFTYVIDLMNMSDKRVNVISRDGLLPPKNSDPLLVELLMEVAREKAIHTQELKLKEITQSYPFKLKNIKAASLTNPLINSDGSNSDKDIREILVGVIRKIDQ